MFCGTRMRFVQRSSQRVNGLTTWLRLEDSPLATSPAMRTSRPVKDCGTQSGARPTKVAGFCFSKLRGITPGDVPLRRRARG